MIHTSGKQNQYRLSNCSIMLFRPPVFPDFYIRCIHAINIRRLLLAFICFFCYTATMVIGINRKGERVHKNSDILVCFSTGSFLFLCLLCRAYSVVYVCGIVYGMRERYVFFLPAFQTESIRLEP